MTDFEPANVGDTVSAHLIIKLEDGTVVEETRQDKEPVKTLLGSADIHPCIEALLVGLRPAERKTSTLGPDDAFGPRDEGAVHVMARSPFPDNLELDVGVVVAFDSAMGQPVAGTIVNLDDLQAEVDFNHPLAGHTILLDVELLDVVARADSSD